MSVRTFGRRPDTTGWNFVWWTAPDRPSAESSACTIRRLPRCGSKGLREGDYRLLVLGVRGDAEADGVTIRTIRREEDEWLSFPADLQQPLGAEYFHSRTPFSVVARKGPSGTELEAVVEEEIVQHRIIGRTDFSFAFNNPYVETALQTRRVTLLAPRFRTGLTGSGLFAGTGGSPDIELDLDEATTWLFPPTAEGEPLHGEVELTTRNYLGHTVRRAYGFTLGEVAPNRIGRVRTTAVHPDDESATAFVTERTFERFGLERILQDDEPKEVYTDAAQRTFNTAAPLQVSVTDDGRLHVRFYSPREVTGLLIRARITLGRRRVFRSGLLRPGSALRGLLRRTADVYAQNLLSHGVGADRRGRSRAGVRMGRCGVPPGVRRSVLGKARGHRARMDHRVRPLRGAIPNGPTAGRSATGWGSARSIAARRWPCS